MVNELFERAKKVMPGGVNSPVRAFAGVGGDPVFMSMGGGANLIDTERNRYVDFVCAWGAGDDCASAERIDPPLVPISPCGVPY